MTEVDGEAAAPSRERELKLVVPGDGLQRLAELGASARIGRFRRIVAPATERMTTTYYDTPDLALAGAGVSLRIRRIGDRAVQTFKAGRRDNGAVFDREEREWPVTTDALDLAKLAADDVRKRLPEIDPRQLHAVFTCEVERTTVTFRSPAGQILLCVDRGVLSASGLGSTPIGELEAELLDGDGTALYDLMLELVRRSDLTEIHVGTEAKSEIGYRLLTGSIPESSKATPLELSSEITLGEGFREILRNGMSHLLANHAAALTGDMDGVHQARVALRRLRAAFWLFGDVLPGLSEDPLRDELKWLASQLAAARDWDVFVTKAMEETPIGPLDRLAATERRAAAHAQATLALRSPRATEMVLGLGSTIETDLPVGDPALRNIDIEAEPLLTVSDDLLDRAARKVCKGRGKSIAALSPEQRHDIRKKLKKLRYGADFLASLYPPKRTKRYLKRMERLQDMLGEMNDSIVAETLRSELPGYEPNAADVMHMPPNAKKLDKAWGKFRKATPFWA